MRRLPLSQATRHVTLARSIAGVLAKPLRLPRFLAATRGYRDQFGAVCGLRVAIAVRKIAHKHPAGSLVPIEVPALRSRVFLRSRSVDTVVFHQVFAQCPLAVPFAENPRFIVDAGAHIGLSSVYLANRFPHSYIIALEVDADNFAVLEKNAAAYDNILPLHKAVWSKRCRVRITNPEADSWSFSVSETLDGSTPSIQAVGIADLLNEFQWDRIDLLKVDIEGAEREVFSCNYESWIDRVNTIAVELHERYAPGSSAAFTRAIAGRGFVLDKRGEYYLARRLARSSPSGASPERRRQDNGCPYE